jgi:hypothetical protein
MPLHIPEPPNDAAAIVRSNFRALVERGDFRLPALRNAVGPLQIVQSHQVYTLGLKDLASGRGIQAAQQTGWRFLIQDGETVVAAAETAATGAGTGHLFAGFNEGPFVASTAEAIRTAQTLPQVEQGKFELRLLRIPALYFMAVWVHNPAETGDLLVPIAPAPEGIVPGRATPASTLLGELATKAEAAADIGPTDNSGG